MVRLSSRKASGSHQGVSLGGVLSRQFWRDDVAKAPAGGLVPGADFGMMTAMYRAVTRQIEVTVEPNFVPEQSSADRSRYFWSYTIVITNSGEETVQLKTRHWIITDASGRQQEVKGEGVVGEQPILAPGERFEYTSGVPLSTASGFMTGRYQMVSETGERFEIDVPTFSLDSPDNKRVLN
ncbi:ApaG protein [Bradyrhizobium yuanmingense]